MGRIDKAYASISEGQVHLRQLPGASDQPPIILLHASPASSASLTGLMEAWQGPHSLFAFDTPCNGQSCPPAIEAPNVTDFADMLDRACDDLGLGEVILHGTHTGAHIAISWAMTRPDRVKAISLDGVALLSEDERAEMLEHYAHPRSPDEYGSQFAWAWQYIRDQMIFFPHYCKDSAHIRAGGSFDPALLHDLTLGVLNNLAHYHLPYYAVFRHQVRDDLARLTQPALVMSGASGVLDKGAEETMRLIPNATPGPGCTDDVAKANALKRFVESL